MEECFIFAVNIGHEMFGGLGEVQNGGQVDDFLAGSMNGGVLLGQQLQITELLGGESLLGTQSEFLLNFSGHYLIPYIIL